jgi:hypothetical protein
MRSEEARIREEMGALEPSPGCVLPYLESHANGCCQSYHCPDPGHRAACARRMRGACWRADDPAAPVNSLNCRAGLAAKGPKKFRPQAGQ